MPTHQKSRLVIPACILILFLAACSGSLLPAGTPGLALTASLHDLQGTVEIWNPGQSDFQPARAGDVLQVQGHIRTGSDGRLRLDLSSGTILRIAPDSMFTLVSNEEQSGSLLTRLIQQAGQIWVILNGGQLEVQTPSGVASVRGSYMSVWVDPVTADVWVACLEGWCQASNPSATLDLLASQGATLFSFDPRGSQPPPPPMLRSLSQEEINIFLENNPEAAQVMDAVIATASALPPLPPTSTPVPPGDCFSPSLPADGAVLSSPQPLTFTWSEQPERYKYILTVTRPDGSNWSQIVWEETFTLPPEMLTQPGLYRWQVTAYDPAIRPICTTPIRTFSLATAPSPTPGAPAACASLLTPANGSSQPAAGEVSFSWTAVANAAKYLLNIKSPDGTITTTAVTNASHLQKMDLLKTAGTYEWWVIAKNSSLAEICTSSTFTFSKAAPVAPATKTPTLTPPPVGTAIFSNQTGPQGNIATCALYFAVNTTPPPGGMVKVILSTNPAPDGNLDPHVVMSLASGTKYTASFDLDDLMNAASGVVIYWRFAIYSGGYTHDSAIYSFISPGCPSGPANTPTSFISISDPGSVVTACPVHFSVKASDPEGLQYIKVQYKVLDTGGVPVVNGDYTHLTFNAATSLWQGDVTFNSLQAGYSVVWWIWAIDNAGNSTYSPTATFTYSP